MKNLIILLLLTGCASKPIFQHRSADGGRVLVLGSRSVNNGSMLEDSKDLMKTHCGNAKITGQGKMPYDAFGKGSTLEQYYDFKCGGESK